MNQSFTLSVLVPVYNERWLVEESLRRVLAFEHPAVERLDVVVVDDGSTDGSREIVARLAAEHPAIRFFPQEVNRGKGAALRVAIEQAEGDISVVHDADLEYDPKDWAKLLEPFLHANADAVYGSRFLASEYRRVLFYRHTLGNQLLTAFSNLMTDLNLTDMETCYKMVRTSLLKSIPLRADQFGVEPEITAKLAKRGAVIYEVPIRYAGRTYREGKKINWRHGVDAFWKILKWRVVDDLYRDDQYGSAILSNLNQVQRINAWMAEAISDHVGDAVLEVGAGIGNLTLQLLPRGRYVASDINQHYLDYLKNLAISRPYLEVLRLDLTDEEAFAALEGGFDTVVCLNVLEHVDDAEAAMANIVRALRPGGKAIVLVPQGQWLYSSLDRVLGHVKRYGHDDLAQVMESAGLELLEQKDFNRIGVSGWLLNGRVLRREYFSKVQLKLLNSAIPFISPLDERLPWQGLSVIAIGRKPGG